MAVVLDGVKLTTDVGAKVQFQLGKEEAKQFYTNPPNLVQGTNREHLSWSLQWFYSVAWMALDTAPKLKPDIFQLRLSKQCIGICATRTNMACTQDLLDDECPNCMQSKENSAHLNQCPEAGETLLFRESMAALVSWMNDYNCTDAKLAYWIEKYLLCCGIHLLTSLVTVGRGGFSQIMTAVAS